MTSINTNLAAVSALRTLQATNTALDATQNRISTGLKIGEAKDNAAYWSISTSLKSDNKAMETVSDALGLGAATVDTAYQGLNSAIDVLNEIKSKLTAATQAGVDKAAVQSEITALQAQLKSIASTSTFSGENWLSVNSATAGYNTNKDIVSSFTRTASGAVSVGTITVDTSTIALFDANSTGQGILDAGKVGNTSLANLAAASAVGVEGKAATAGKLTYALANTDLTGLAVGDKVRFNLTIDANAAADYDITIANSPPTRTEIASLLNTAVTARATVGLSDDGLSLVFTSKTTGAASKVNLNTITSAAQATPTDFTATRNINDSTGATGTPIGVATVNFAAAKAEFGTFGSAITLDADDTISFMLSVDGSAAKLVTIDKATVSSALGSTDGVIGDGTKFATVLTKALTNAGITTATVAYNTGDNKLSFTSNATSGASSVLISNTAAARGNSIVDINIVGKSAEQITKSIDAVNSAINSITSAASKLGAVSKRIELQKTFVTNLMDTIEKGVSGLVDADMNEESTKLQALQVKQQLGVQALSIANQSAQNVLSLFRS